MTTTQIDYTEKLRDPRWQKRRLEVFNRENFTCQCCGTKEETLHVHHLVYRKDEPWESPDSDLECLCESCHEFREDFNQIAGRSPVPTKLCNMFIRWGVTLAKPKSRRPDTNGMVPSFAHFCFFCAREFLSPGQVEAFLRIHPEEKQEAPK